MQYLARTQTSIIKRKLQQIPAVAILGPRQCGKSTLAKMLLGEIPESLYLDLERPSDRNKLQDAEAFLSLNRERLICLDEIQRLPEIFPVLRSHIDENNRNGQLLVLGSASPNLLRQTSESLAGRIAYIELSPFSFPEIKTSLPNPKDSSLHHLWLRGGFPRSYLADSENTSFEWRLDFMRTFLERDIPQLGFRIPSPTLDRFWKMCAHSHGQLLNNSKIGDSLGKSNHTIRSYMELLSETFMVRMLMPFEGNLKKRLVKTPKVYLRDSGLLHGLLGIESHNDLLGHPTYGVSWEGFVIENVLANLKPTVNASFYRASSGAELDLILEKGNRKVGIECKASSSPSTTKGFWSSIEDTGVNDAYIIAPVKEPYPIQKDVRVLPLQAVFDERNLTDFLILGR